MPEQLPQAPSHAAPVQPLYGQSDTEPSVVQPPAYQRTAAPPPQAMRFVPAQREPSHEASKTVDATLPAMTIVSHSSLFYWWPVWAVGYLCALFTYFNGQAIQLGKNSVNMHTSNNLGVFFFLTLFVVILISNVIVRGLASAVVILSVITATVILAYFDLWDSILGWLGELTIYLNQGAYFWFSTLMFVVWAFTTFVFDRMSLWHIRPGQITHAVVLGASARSYDTENMSFEKRRDDVFRHWLLGLGSGDLIVNAFNAGKPEEIHIPNVLFIGMKIRAIQQLIAMKATDAVPQAHA